MTKNQAMREITSLSSGTIATIICNSKYERIDAAVCEWIESIAHTAETTFKDCKNWVDVLSIIRR